MSERLSFFGSFEATNNTSLRGWLSALLRSGHDGAHFCSENWARPLQCSPPKTKTSISEIIGGTAIVAQNGSVGMMSTRFSCVLQMPCTGECVAGKALHGGMRCMGGTVEFRWMRFRYFTHLFSIALPVYTIDDSRSLLTNTTYKLHRLSWLSCCLPRTYFHSWLSQNVRNKPLGAIRIL